MNALNYLTLAGAVSSLVFCTPVCADEISYGGVSGGDWATGSNWSSGSYPTTADHATLNTTASLDTSVPNNIRAIRIGTSGAGVFHVAPAGSLSASAHTSWDSHIGNGSGNSGTLNQYGGTVNINELEIGRDSSTGFYNLYAGTLTLARLLKDYSIYLGTDDGKSLAGTGTLYISGGSLLTRAGIYLGPTSGGTGVFHVEGAGATTIGIGSNGSIDGAWLQNAGSTLRIRIDKSSTGVTPIFIDYVDGTGLGGNVTFESGALLDVGFTEGFVNGGTYTVMQWEGNVTNNGLQFASSVDTNIWSFTVDATNKKLTVTAAGDSYVRTFVHPGLSHKLSDMERMRDMVAAGAEPWTSTYNSLKTHGRAQYDYHCAAANTNTITTMTDYWDAYFINDGTAAYYNALMWMLTGDSRHADKSIEILNAWSYLTRNEQTLPLENGRHWRIMEAAEIIQSTYSGWSETDKNRFKDMLVYPGYSSTTVPTSAIASDDVTFYWRIYNGDPKRHGNQGLFAQRVMLAMAVFLDNEIMYDRAVNYLKGHPHRSDDVAYPSGPPNTSGPLGSSNEYYDEYSQDSRSTTVTDYGYNEVMWNYIWENGQSQESSRDQAHALAGVSTIASMCEIMWNQSDNVYGYLDNRPLLGLEHYYRYNLSWTNSYPDQPTPWEPTVGTGEFIQRLDRSGRWKSLKINPYTGANLNPEDWERARHNLQPVYEMNLGHYRDRMNVSSNETKWLERGFDFLVSEQGFETEGTVTDHPGYGGLKFRRVSPGDPISGFSTSNTVLSFEMNSLPLKIEAENYDYFPIFGQHLTYYDLSEKNTGGEYRPVDAVDISTCSEGGYALSSIESSEWVTYTVSVTNTSTYDISIRYAAVAAGGKISFSFDGTNVTGEVDVPYGGSGSTGATDWRSLVVASDVNLDQGVKQLKISFSGVSGAFLLNHFAITEHTILSAIGHWTFDETSGTTAVDSSGGGHDGSVDHALWTNGIIGGALYFDGTGNVDLPGAAFASLSNEVSISFWARGDDAVPNNSAFYAIDSGNNRVLNTHLPVGTTVYWDAGDSGYDRISQGAAEWELEGSWSHWVFTKNATSGTMKIFRNGVQWLSGTGRTKTMTGIVSGYIGGQAGGNYYKGIIDDVRLYDRELSVADVALLHAEPYDGLIAHWTFDETDGTTAVDLVGGYNGTVAGATPVWTDGVVGGALAFNGTDTSVAVGNALESVSNELTIAFWCYGDSSQPTQINAFSGGSGRQLNCHFPWDGPTIYFDANSPSLPLDRITKGVSTLEDLWGRWNHWVFTKNASNGTMAMYVNGVQVASGTGKTGHMDGIDSLWIGSSLGTGNFYHGLMDDFRVYNRELTIAEIQNFGKRLIGEWTFNEGSGTTVANTASTGSAHDGIVNGTPTWVTGYNGVGTALDFGGTIGNFVSILSPDFLDSVSSEISIAFWGYGNTNQPANNVAFQGQVGTAGRELQSHLPYSNQRIYWDAADRYDYSATGSPELWKTNWTFWVMTKNTDTGSMKVYANGVLHGSVTGKNNTINGAGITRFAIGGPNDGTSDIVFPGIIDEFQVYNYELSVGDIGTLYDDYVSAAQVTTNGTPIAWLESYGLTAADDGLDSDGDGLLTWLEYVVGTVPTDASSLLEITSVSRVGTASLVTWQSVAGKTYSLYTNWNLVTGSFNIATSGVPGQAGETSVILDSAPATLFLGVGVEE